jgi:hypothetical protein
MICKNINEYNTTARRYNSLAVVYFQVIDFKIKIKSKSKSNDVILM